MRSGLELPGLALDAVVVVTVLSVVAHLIGRVLAADQLG